MVGAAGAHPVFLKINTKKECYWKVDTLYNRHFLGKGNELLSCEELNIFKKWELVKRAIKEQMKRELYLFTSSSGSDSSLYSNLPS